MRKNFINQSSCQKRTKKTIEMKKYVCLLIVVALATTMNAQESYNKPDDSKFSLEIGIMPFQYESAFLIGEQLRGILAINDNISLRLGVGFGTAKETEDDKQADYTKSTTTTSQFSVSPGIIFSFAGTNKLTPFVGFEVMVGSTSNQITQEQRRGNSLTKTVITNADSPINTFGANVFTGFNYYFAKNIYVGVEAGIGVINISEKKQSIKITSDGSTTTRDTEAEVGAIGFGIVCNPAIRLGWAF